MNQKLLPLLLTFGLVTLIQLYSFRKFVGDKATAYVDIKVSALHHFLKPKNNNNTYFDQAKSLLKSLLRRKIKGGISEKRIRNISKYDPLNLISNLHQNFTNRKCGWLVNGYSMGMGLGNMMFVYASVFGIAKRNDKIPIVSEDSGDPFPLKRFFTLSAPTLKKLHKSVERQGLYETACCKYKTLSENLDCESNYRMFGYFQSWRYFDNAFQEIKNEFQFKGRVLRECKKTLSTLLTDYSVDRSKCSLIGAHMRRGDFTYSHKQAFGHVPASGKYLRKAIRYYKTRHKGECLKFLIYGNDYSWNKREAPSTNDVIVMKLSSPAVDMCVLSSCNHSIISTGTFGFWSAFLAGGHATYQKQFARYGSQHYEEYSETDYFRPGWVPL